MNRTHALLLDVMAQRLPVIFEEKKQSLIFSDVYFVRGKNKRISDKNKEEMSGGFHLFCCQAILPRLFKDKYRQVSFSPKNMKYIEDTEYFFASLYQQMDAA
jgi:hypothetical protein